MWKYCSLGNLRNVTSKSNLGTPDSQKSDSKNPEFCECEVQGNPRFPKPNGLLREFTLVYVPQSYSCHNFRS